MKGRRLVRWRTLSVAFWLSWRGWVVMVRRRVVRLLGAAVAIWALAWIGLGIAIAVEVNHLTVLSHGVVRDGHAAQSIGTSLQALRGVPFVGGSIAADGVRVQQAGGQAVSGATSATGTIQTLSVLLGVTVALLPSVPAVGFYLVVRGRRALR